MRGGKGERMRSGDALVIGLWIVAYCVLLLALARRGADDD